jgi:hypothetical protein
MPDELKTGNQDAYIAALESLHTITAQTLAKVPRYAYTLHPELSKVLTAVQIVEQMRKG